MAARPWAAGSSPAARTGGSAFSFPAVPFPLGTPGPETPPGPQLFSSGSLDSEQSPLVSPLVLGLLQPEQLLRQPENPAVSALPPPLLTESTR